MSATEASATAPPATGYRLTTQVAGIAGYLDELRRANRRGDLAMLRRLGREQGGVPPEVFWRIVDRYEITPGEEAFWLAVLPLMVKYPHRPGAHPGAALSRAGVKSARLERWLRLDRPGALREASRLLSKVDGPLDWVALAHLLRSWSEDGRRRLARDFFLSPEQRDSLPSHTGDE